MLVKFNDRRPSVAKVCEWREEDTLPAPAGLEPVQRVRGRSGDHRLRRVPCPRGVFLPLPPECHPIRIEQVAMIRSRREIQRISVCVPFERRNAGNQAVRCDLALNVEQAASPQDSRASTFALRPSPERLMLRSLILPAVSIRVLMLSINFASASRRAKESRPQKAK